MGLHENKKFMSAKDTVSRENLETAEWRKIFNSCTSDKVLMDRIYKYLQKLNTKKINLPTNKWANELKRVKTNQSNSKI